MTPEQHRESIVSEFVDAYRKKYDKGQAEHGGELWLKDNMALAKEEVLDFVAYVYSADWQRKEAVRIIERAIRKGSCIDSSGQVEEALALLRGDAKDIR